MTLREALEQIERHADDEVVFAKKPWSMSTEAIFGKLDEQCRVPSEIADAGFDYFIDLPVAREVLSVLRSRRTTAEKRIELLMYYGENDAYPDWVSDPAD